MATPQIKALSVSAGIPPARHSRSAFTLVELLVVIGIIGTITAISLPAIFGAIASARNAKTKAEIDMLHVALMSYKNEYGSFPPANMNGLWNGSSVNTAHPAYKHLARIFPRLSEDTSASGPYPALAQLSPAQALVFWLQGFYENPQYPLTNGNAGAGTRRKLFDFDESRLYSASTYAFNGTPQTFAARTGPTAYPVYFTGHPTCGLPYVYFDSRCYTSAPGSDISYAATNTSGDTSIASPYINSLPPVNGTWGQQHMAGDTFQLIAGGKDGRYGDSSINQAAFPAKSTYSLSWNNASYTYPSTKDTTNGRGHGDNLTNFSDRALASAVEALQ